MRKHMDIDTYKHGYIRYFAVCHVWCKSKEAILSHVDIGLATDWKGDLATIISLSEVQQLEIQTLESGHHCHVVVSDIKKRGWDRVRFEVRDLDQSGFLLTCRDVRIQELSVSEEPAPVKLQVKHILLKHWDPIGIAEFPEAHDEYDTYVGEVHHMLLRGDDLAAITDYLRRAVSERMGIREEPERTNHVARMLARLVEKTAE